MNLQKKDVQQIVKLVVSNPSIEFINIIYNKLKNVEPTNIVAFIKEEYANYLYATK